MKLFTIKPSGKVTEVEECKDEVYSKLAKSYACIEINNRICRRNNMRGSVAAYTPSGSHCRVWGQKLISSSLPILWREYTKLFLVMGIVMNGRIYSSYMNILKGYIKSSREERWVVFFKIQSCQPCNACSYYSYTHFFSYYILVKKWPILSYI